MKNFFIFLLTICIISASFTTLADFNLDDAIILYVDSNMALSGGKEVKIDENESVVPIVENGRTLVPVRFIAESLGMEVSFDEGTNKVSLTDDTYSITFTIGSNIYFLGDEQKLIDPENENVAAKVENGRTLVPMRCLAEAVGRNVAYDRGLIIISKEPYTDFDKSVHDGLISRLNALPKVGSAENLKKLIGDASTDYYRGYRTMAPGIAVTDDSLAVQDMSAAMESASGGAAKHSETNVQVEGVDEADLVKTDGKYIYQVRQNKVTITQVHPVSDMKVMGSITFDEQDFYPTELYIDGDMLVAIGSSHKAVAVRPMAESRKMIAPEYIAPMQNFSKVLVYDISDRENPVKARDFEVEGGYLSSRKIGDYVYMVSTQYHWYGILREDYATIYTDNGTEGGVGYDRLCYFPRFETPSYMTISAINISNKDEKPKVESMLGAGNNIYVSLENMYVANTIGSDKTVIYKFSLDKGNITYLKKAEVKGQILNQFSMDEYAGYFRIATTSYGGQMKNNLYVLDETLSLCGSVEDIAPDERIYSARFVGDRGYMVTFRQVDPLFVIDLADPYAPKILGQLKIPGYSNYIHPVDENHILGFGKDATGDGLYQGMKMALFDVSDVTNPIQKFEEIIGDRGTESPLLQSHKALLFARDLELLAFPVTVREVLEKDRYGASYGQLTFSGAYVYSFSTQSGFDLRGKITHLSDDDMLKLGNYVDYNKEISRIMYVGNSLITISNSEIFAHDMDTVEYQNSINLDK
ncbi:MAG: beta-propeller domain-containing protein [Eubacteriales bacterium]|jgi:uncharacterized secreted protein with C-terminal beta-propeller domain|nr:beta-propeller domain-containing protein [Eubacteriales bacterium]